MSEFLLLILGRNCFKKWVWFSVRLVRQVRHAINKCQGWFLLTNLWMQLQSKEKEIDKPLKIVFFLISQSISSLLVCQMNSLVLSPRLPPSSPQILGLSILERYQMGNASSNLKTLLLSSDLTPALHGKWLLGRQWSIQL